MEAAIAIGSLVAVLAVVLGTVGAVVVQIRCVDAVGEAARLAARGDDEGARGVAARLLPSGTEVVVEAEGDDVRVRVRAPPLGEALPGLRLGADAVAAREADSAGPAPGADAAPDVPVPDVPVPAGPVPPAGLARGPTSPGLPP